MHYSVHVQGLEVPKQPYYKPLPTEKQIVVIYVATNSFCDGLALLKVTHETPYEKYIYINTVINTMCIIIKLVHTYQYNNYIIIIH
jgi:F0F1-type ATP synthase alpha subunit